MVSLMFEMPKQQMTVDEFLAWAETQPGRHELVHGRVLAMAPERVRHAEAKFSVQAALKTSIGRAGVPCHMLPDGMTVRVDRMTAYEPDALVYCGPRLPDEATEVPNPIIVVEVLSPSTGNYDRAGKLIGYFMLPSVQHYLILDPDRRVVVHHRRDGDAIATRILGSGILRLDPPGLAIALDDLLGAPLPAE